MARIHQHRENYAGNPSGSFQVPLHEFHHHLGKGAAELVSKFHYDNEKIVSMLPKVMEFLNSLPHPEFATFVLVDIDPSQFLSDGKEISGLVDTEAYVVAPRELDFIGLEYILDEKSAKDFIVGYEKIMPIPDLQKVRLPYRYYYRLLSVQGDVELDDWLGWEVLF